MAFPIILYQKQIKNKNAPKAIRQTEKIHCISEHHRQRHDPKRLCEEFISSQRKDKLASHFQMYIKLYHCSNVLKIMNNLDFNVSFLCILLEQIRG